MRATGAMRARLTATGAVFAVALVGCASTVNGTGRTELSPGVPGGQSSPGLPSASASASSAPSTAAPATEEPTGGATSSAPARPTTCPHVVYPGAKLEFDCITTGMRAAYDGNIWPFSEYRTVEASTKWVLEEGAGHWGSADGVALADIARNVRQQMIDNGGYGTRPGVRTVGDRATTVDGATAHLLQTTFTINPAYARRVGTDVKQERLWILAIEVGPGDVSLWYASIPNLAKALWAKVPMIIDSITVG